MPMMTPGELRELEKKVSSMSNIKTVTADVLAFNGMPPKKGTSIVLASCDGEGKMPYNIAAYHILDISQVPGCDLSLMGKEVTVTYELGKTKGSGDQPEHLGKLLDLELGNEKFHGPSQYDN